MQVLKFMEKMKYTLRKVDGKYRLFRYDEDKGLPNNAEMEFWFKIEELVEAYENYRKDIYGQSVNGDDFQLRCRNQENYQKFEMLMFKMREVLGK